MVLSSIPARGPNRRAVLAAAIALASARLRPARAAAPPLDRDLIGGV